MKISFLTVFLLVLQMATAQKPLLDFALRNEMFFRVQVSKFYPIPENLLKKYAEDWLWNSLSENQNLAWTDNFIERFSEKWSWPDIFRNSKIIWTEERIDRLGEDADWFYLSQNPSLPLSENFIRKYEKRIDWYFLSQNPAFLRQEDLVKIFQNRLEKHEPNGTSLYPVEQVGGYLNYPHDNFPAELLAIRQQPIVELDPQFFEKYQPYWNFKSLLECEFLNWDLQRVEQFLARVEPDFYLFENPKIFQQVIQPHLMDALLDEIMQRLNPSDVLRFYVLQTAYDEFGITQSVYLKDKNHGDNPLNFPVAPADTFQMSNMILSSYEPPLRFSPLHDWGINKPYNVYAVVVSEKVKAVLEEFVLPPHRFYPFKLSYFDENYGSDSRQYFVFHIENREQWDGFDLILSKADNGLLRILVNEDVKKALETADLGKVGFQKIRKENPVVAGTNTPAHREKNARIIEKIRNRRAAHPPEPEQISIKNFKEKQQWRLALLTKKGLVEAYRKAHPLLVAKSRVLDTLRQKELEFEVILPPIYLEKMSGDLQKFRRYRVPDCTYDILPARKITQFSDKKYPFAAKAVLFAANGLGDSLGFLLQAGSEFELDDMVYEFLHETGDIVPVGRLK